MILTAKYNYGWYGQCGSEPCAPIELSVYVDQIDRVFQISEFGGNYASWISGDPDFLQSFTQLECGRAYNIVLKDDQTVNIPNFIRTDVATSEAIKLLADNCNMANQPTPTPTVTPGPTETITTQRAGRGTMGRGVDVPSTRRPRRGRGPCRWQSQCPRKP